MGVTTRFPIPFLGMPSNRGAGRRASLPALISEGRHRRSFRNNLRARPVVRWSRYVPGLLEGGCPPFSFPLLQTCPFPFIVACRSPSRDREEVPHPSDQKPDHVPRAGAGYRARDEGPPGAQGDGHWLQGPGQGSAGISRHRHAWSWSRHIRTRVLLASSPWMSSVQHSSQQRGVLGGEVRTQRGSGRSQRGPALGGGMEGLRRLGVRDARSRPSLPFRIPHIRSRRQRSPYQTKASGHPAMISLACTLRSSPLATADVISIMASSMGASHTARATS